MLTDMAFDRLHFFQRSSWRLKSYSQDAARSRPVKGKYQGHRGQRPWSLCSLIGQKGTISSINDILVLN